MSGWLTAHTSLRIHPDPSAEEVKLPRVASRSQQPRPLSTSMHTKDGTVLVSVVCQGCDEERRHNLSPRRWCEASIGLHVMPAAAAR